MKLCCQLIFTFSFVELLRYQKLYLIENESMMCTSEDALRGKLRIVKSTKQELK